MTVRSALFHRGAHRRDQFAPFDVEPHAQARPRRIDHRRHGQHGRRAAAPPPPLLQARAGHADDAGRRRGGARRTRADRQPGAAGAARLAADAARSELAGPPLHGARRQCLARVLRNECRQRCAGALQGRRLRGRRGRHLSARRARPAHRVGPQGRPHLLSQGDARLRRHDLAPRRDGVSGHARRADLDRFVERLSRGFDRIADDACGDNLFSSPQPANAPAPAQPKADEKPAPN